MVEQTISISDSGDLAMSLRVLIATIVRMMLPIDVDFDSDNEDCDDIIFETVVMVDIVIMVVVIINTWG